MNATNRHRPDVPVGSVWETPRHGGDYHVRVLADPFPWEGAWWVPVKLSASNPASPDVIEASALVDVGRRLS